MRTSVFSRSTTRSASAVALAASGLLLLLGACTSVQDLPGVRRTVHFLEPYRADVIQGNVVTAEQIARVKPGMTRTQVRDTLGTPLLADPFHAERWDYVFTMQRQGVAPVRRAFTVRFKEDAVTQVDAADLPTEDKFVQDISPDPLPRSTPKLELSDAERAKLPPPVGAAAPPPVAASGTGPQRAYPPLEAS